MSEFTNNAVMADSNLISFSGVSSSQRTDILDLIMDADRFASNTWSREKDWNSWILYYRSQLARSGCQLKSQIVRPAMVINSVSELDNINFGVTDSMKVGGLIDLTRRSLRQSDLTNYAHHFFESGSDSGFLSTFQVVPCQGAGADDVSILICGLHAKANVTVESRGGDSRTNREMVVRLAGGIYQFNTRRFAPHRQGVQSRLLSAARFNLQALSI